MGISYRREFDLPAIQGDVRQLAERVLRYAAFRAEAVAKQEAPRDTGALARSIVPDVQSFQARVFSPLQYAAVMEAGRRPGARMPPPGALVGWMTRHGFVPPGVRRTPIELAFPFAQMIGRRGIQGRFFFRKAAETVERELPGLIQRAIRELGG
jgi:Bacteriophage HK97-gp10, putative tail-component